MGISMGDSGSFHRPLILIHQRAGRMKITITESWTNWLYGQPTCLIKWNYEPCCVGPPKMNGSWWRVLTKRGPLMMGMANHFSILALRTPWTVWKGKKVGLKDGLPKSVSTQYTTGDQWRNNSRKNKKMEPKQKHTQCGCDWWWK